MDKREASPKRKCHICGTECTRWCEECLRTFGDRRKPANQMAKKEKIEEIKRLLSPPYEVPFSMIYTRVVELHGSKEGVSLLSFFKVENTLEADWARRNFKEPMFRWPPGKEQKPEPAGPPPVPLPEPAPAPASMPQRGGTGPRRQKSTTLVWGGKDK